MDIWANASGCCGSGRGWAGANTCLDHAEMLCASTGCKLLAERFSTGWAGNGSCQPNIWLLHKRCRPHLGCARGAHARTAPQSARSSGPPGHSPTPQRGDQQTHQPVGSGAVRSGWHKGAASAAAQMTVQIQRPDVSLALQGCWQAQAAASSSSGKHHFRC